jgi:hypothetical protein
VNLRSSFHIYIYFFHLPPPSVGALYPSSQQGTCKCSFTPERLSYLALYAHSHFWKHKTCGAERCASVVGSHASYSGRPALKSRLGDLAKVFHGVAQSFRTNIGYHNRLFDKLCSSSFKSSHPAPLRSVLILSSLPCQGLPCVSSVEVFRLKCFHFTSPPLRTKCPAHPNNIL